jgi:hypothetical protein
MRRAGRDFNSFKWSSNPDQYYDNWYDCYEERLNFDKNSVEGKFMRNGGADLVRTFESEFDCAGICDVPLFYMTQSISMGPPTVGCIEAAAKGMASKLSTAGYVALLTGILMWIGMIAACPLCSGFTNKE